MSNALIFEVCLYFGTRDARYAGQEHIPGMPTRGNVMSDIEQRHGLHDPH